MNIMLAGVTIMNVCVLFHNITKCLKYLKIINCVETKKKNDGYLYGDVERRVCRRL